MYKLSRDERGVAATEFALIMVPMFLIIMGAIELGYMQFNNVRMQMTLSSAARIAQTGDIDRVGLDGEKIDAMVKRELTFLDGATVQIHREIFQGYSMQPRPEPKDKEGTAAPYCFSDENRNGKWDVAPQRRGRGGPGDVILYRATVDYPPLFPFVTNSIGVEGNISLARQTVFKNEPFPNEANPVPKCCVSSAKGNPTTCT